MRKFAILKEMSLAFIFYFSFMNTIRT